MLSLRFKPLDMGSAWMAQAGAHGAAALLHSW